MAVIEGETVFEDTYVNVEESTDLTTALWHKLCINIAGGDSQLSRECHCRRFRIHDWQISHVGLQKSALPWDERKGRC